MRALSIALSLVRIPRLFFSLLLGPLLIGTFFVTVQEMFVYAHFMSTINSGSDPIKERIEESQKESWIRKVLFGDAGPLPPLKVCRWQTTSQGEQPPSDPDCKTVPYDVTIRTTSPETFDATRYIQMLEGSTHNLHICRKCVSEIMIGERDGKFETHLLYPAALLVYIQSAVNDSERTNALIEAYKRSEEVKELQGAIMIHFPGHRFPINYSTLENDMIIVMNIAVFAVIALWLSLRSHRKVLDYFARNGALLPLVAACGKRPFYTAIWHITGLRVLLFMFSSVPVAGILLYNMVDDEEFTTSIFSNPSSIVIWLSALILGLAAITVLGSIAELKHRQGLTVFIYKYLPIIACFIGGLIWSISFFHKGEHMEMIRNIITSTPVLGLLPTLVSPIFHISDNALLAHTFLSALMAGTVMLGNSRWFAAHLEEL